VAEAELKIVTGALSYTGGYIARELVRRGHAVRALTGHPRRASPLRGRIETAPYAFDNPAALRASLSGATTLFNTYWVRFPYRGQNFDTAVADTRVLIDAARDAGIRRIVHISVTNPSLDSRYSYFRGKARVERMIDESALSYAIIRPSLIFGVDDVLINNIAWLLRRFPVFAVPGDGSYRVQPVYAGDVAALAADCDQSARNEIIDAVGSEVFTFDDFVGRIAAAISSRAARLHVPPLLARVLIGLIGAALHDVLLTRDEMYGLMDELLTSAAAPIGPTRFSTWIEQNASKLGADYVSELDRHFR
jgi:uncharacterized protein YbjT (DUF2867 family)